MMKKRKKNYISFLVFSSKNPQNISFKLSHTTIFSILFAIVFGFSALGIGLILSYQSTYKQTAYKKLKETLHTQEIKWTETNQTLLTMKDQIRNLLESEDQLELILGKATLSKKKKQ